MIYLDNAATTRLDPRVLTKMMPYLTDNYANASSIHEFGQQAYSDLMKAKERVAKILNGSVDNIVFTSGATESNNFIIKGIARANKEKGNKIIVSSIEHPCVLQSARELIKEGFKVIELPVNKDGLVELESLEKVIDDKTILVSVMTVNNEIGTIQDIKGLANIAHKHGAFFHTDAVQAVPYLKIDIKKLEVDFLSLSAHKFYGPKGVGLAYINRDIKIKPLIVGGGQENNYRSGTYNLAGITGFSFALELAYKERDKYIKRVKELRNYLWKSLNKEISGLKVNGTLQKRIPANLNIMFGQIEGEAILIDLSSKGICVSTGSACSAFDLKASHVLKAIGLNDHNLNSNIRFSLGRFNTKKEIDYTIRAFKKTVARLRKFSPIK